MIYKARGVSERYISAKTRIASVLNGLKNEQFCTHPVRLVHEET